PTKTYRLSEGRRERVKGRKGFHHWKPFLPFFHCIIRCQAGSAMELHVRSDCLYPLDYGKTPEQPHDLPLGGPRSGLARPSQLRWQIECEERSVILLPG